MINAATIPVECDLPTARAKVARFIATVPSPGKYPWEIKSEADHGDYWLFTWVARSDFWPRRKYCPTAGNNPIAVRKSDGAVYMWNLLCSWESFVERVRDRKLHPYGVRLE